MYPSHSIVMRHSRLEEDVRTLAGLASLGSRPEPRGPALLAATDGAPRAAHLSDGSVAAKDTRETWRVRVKSIVFRSQPARC